MDGHERQVYCLSCKAFVDLVGAKDVLTKRNNMPMTRGKCRVCGNTVTFFRKKIKEV